MYINIYLYTYINIYANIYLNKYIQYIHIHAWIYVYINTKNTHTCINIYINVYVDICIHCILTQISVWIRAYNNTKINNRTKMYVIFPWSFVVKKQQWCSRFKHPTHLWSLLSLKATCCFIVSKRADKCWNGKRLSRMLPQHYLIL